MARDPVCGMHVENHAAFKVERGGKTYYFCSEGCMLTFQQPDRELKKLRNLGVFSFALGILTFIVMFTSINLPILPMEWWALIDVRRVPVDKLRQIDPELYTLMDVDTADDLSRVRRLFERAEAMKIIYRDSRVKDGYSIDSLQRKMSGINRKI